MYDAPPPDFLVSGLDLGQSADYSCLIAAGRLRGRRTGGTSPAA